MNYLTIRRHLRIPSIIFICLILGCSNSENTDYWVRDDIFAPQDSEETTNSTFSKEAYLPLDDSEYPYAGLPRIVIETKNHQAINDRETEIPAKLQIWGEHSPESEIMELTIKGRGNTSWEYSKKPYAIKFEKKQNLLGMPKAKKWVMLANYRDRTLIRNALAFEIARHTSQKWVPQGKFVDVFLNNTFIGNYYVCEKIQASQNRLNLENNSFLLELDIGYDEEYKFKSAYKKFPVNIKSPNNPSSNQLQHIKSFIDSIECCFYGPCKESNGLQMINLESLASFWIVQEIAQNWESIHPKSVYLYKDSIINFGPIWDFDWQTFTTKKSGMPMKESLWLDTLSKNALFKNVVKNEWTKNKKSFYSLISFIDSLANYIEISNERSYKKWPIKLRSNLAGDENEDFPTAIKMLKDAYINRLNELDSLYQSL